MHAENADGATYAVAYGMAAQEEEERIATGVNPEKHFAALRLLADALGKSLVG